MPPRLDFDVSAINDLVREACQALGCHFYRCRLDAIPSHFKKGDPVHLSHDGGLPQLIQSIVDILGRTTATTIIHRPAPLPNSYKQKKKRWYHEKRVVEYQRRVEKRQSTQQSSTSMITESSEIAERQKMPVKDIDLILQEIGPHPVVERSVVAPTKVKGKLQNLDSFPNFYRLLRCLRMLSPTACGGATRRYVQYTDARGNFFHLSLDDLRSIESVYIDSFIFIIATVLYFQRRTFLSSCSKISPCGGGNGRNNDESNLIKIREVSSESELMKLPPTSNNEDDYTIINADKSALCDDIRQISRIPSVPICVKMLNELNKYSIDELCVQTRSGNVFSKNLLRTVLSHKYEIRAKDEICTEKAWLREIENENIPCPPGLSVELNVRFVQEALEYLHGDVSDTGRGTYANLKFDSIRGLVNNNCLTDDFLDHLSNKINSQSSSDVFCFFYDRMDLNTYDIAETVLNKYRDLDKNALRQLVMLCRVRNVVIGDNQAFTHIGDFLTEGNEVLAADHYVMLVFDSDFQTVTYCDSKGWKAPPDISNLILSVSETFFDQQQFCNFNYAHSPSNSANIENTHICTEVCSKYYPLQTCGTICGVAVLISAVIAVLDIDCFRKLFATAEIAQNKFEHLRDISKYSAFYRSVLLKWLKCNISIDDIVPIDFPDSSITAQQSLGIDNDFTENEFAIPLNKQNKELLSSDSDLSLSMLANRIFDHCNPSQLECTKKGLHLHCKLCNMKPVMSKNTLIHFKTVHKKLGVEGENNFYLSCTTSNHTVKETNRSHYHCGFCKKVISQKKKFQTHLQVHQKNEKRKRENDMFDVEELISQPPIKRIQLEKDVQCPICDLVLLGSSLKRHMTTHKKMIVPESITVDRNRAIFMVPKSPHHGGIRYPIHVQKMIKQNETKIFCEHPDCIAHHKIFKESGGSLVSCDHLDLVNERTTQIKEPEKLNEDFLFSENTPIAKSFKEETIKKCSDLNKLAILGNYPTIVPFLPNGNHVHLSVWTSQQDDPCARLGRVIVTYDKDTRKISCGCCLQNRIPCVHKAMALWYLCQTGTIDNHNDIPSTLDTGYVSDKEPLVPPEVNSKFSDSQIDACQDKKINQKSNCYPPKNQESIERIIEYLHSYKKYNKVHLHRKVDFRTKLEDRKIIPIETKCIHCDVPLQAPLRINKNGKVLTFSDGLVGPFSVYVKKCPSCEMFYRYQECTDGIHNIDDDLFVEMRLNLFLKENLQEHNSIGGAVASLSRLPGMTKLNEAKILDGYFMFDVLSTTDCPFFCAQCGYHPHILIADLNRKLAFRCDMDDVEDVDDINDETAGDVDSDKFWTDIECSILASAFPGSVKTKFSVKPSFKYWSPYIGKNSRKTNIMLNTEYKKLDRKTGTFDPEYLKELTEERLFELVSQKPLKVLKNIAKEMKMTNFSGKNRREILKAIQTNLSGDNQSFGKLFLNMGGFSGGYLTYNCIHGISYYLKMPIRTEGPRDYIDGLLSMKHLPNVTIIDMPQHLVKHSESRQNDILRTNNGNEAGELFFPFEGRAGDCNDQDNVLKANENKFRASFPCLSGEPNDKDNDSSHLSHPVTGSSIRMALFDRFHENNSNSSVEDLRKLQCVKELYGQLNSQVAEQLHKSFNSNKRFLNAMSPHHFAYLLRSMLNYRNELKNEAFIEKQKSRGYDLHRNELGKIQLKLGFDRAFTNNSNTTYRDGIHDVDFLISEIEKSSVEDENVIDNEKNNVDTKVPLEDLNISFSEENDNIHVSDNRLQQMTNDIALCVRGLSEDVGKRNEEEEEKEEEKEEGEEEEEDKEEEHEDRNIFDVLNSHDSDTDSDLPEIDITSGKSFDLPRLKSLDIDDLLQEKRELVIESQTPLQDLEPLLDIGDNNENTAKDVLLEIIEDIICNENRAETERIKNELLLSDLKAFLTDNHNYLINNSIKRRKDVNAINPGMDSSYEIESIVQTWYLKYNKYFLKKFTQEQRKIYSDNWETFHQVENTEDTEVLKKFIYGSLKCPEKEKKANYLMICKMSIELIKYTNGFLDIFHDWRANGKNKL